MPDDIPNDNDLEEVQGLSRDLPEDPNNPAVEPPQADTDLDSGLDANFVVPDEFLESLPGEAAATLAVPPPTAMTGAPLFSDTAYLAPGAMEGLLDAEAPVISGDLAPDKKTLKRMVTPEKQDALWKTADDTALEVNDKVDSLGIARQLLNQIRSAKTYLLAGPAFYEEAERAVNEVKYRIAFGERTKVYSDTVGKKIFWYELLWALVILTLVVFIPNFALRFVETGGGNIGLDLPFPAFIKPNDVYNAVSGMLWGGAGGVVGALYALWRHVTEQDFNPQYRVWYYTQPIMGLPIGAFIFVFIQIGFTITAGDPNVQINSSWMIWLLAFIAAFQQNVFYNIIRQILRQFKIADDELSDTNSKPSTPSS